MECYLCSYLVVVAKKAKNTKTNEATVFQRSLKIWTIYIFLVNIENKLE